MMTPNSVSVTPCRPGRILPLALCAAAMLLAECSPGRHRRGAWTCVCIRRAGSDHDPAWRASGVHRRPVAHTRPWKPRSALSTWPSRTRVSTPRRRSGRSTCGCGPSAGVKTRSTERRAWFRSSAESIPRIRSRRHDFSVRRSAPGASSFQGLSFDTDPRFIEEATTRLMPEAVRAARARAESLASAESRAVGRLVRIVESGVSHRPPVLERPMSASTSAARSSTEPRHPRAQWRRPRGHGHGRSNLRARMRPPRVDRDETRGILVPQIDPGARCLRLAELSARLPAGRCAGDGRPESRRHTGHAQ